MQFIKQSNYMSAASLVQRSWIQLSSNFFKSGKSILGSLDDRQRHLTATLANSSRLG